MKTTETSAPNGRPVLIVLLAGAATALGSAIPMPGIDPRDMAEAMQSSWGPGMAAGFSILALGLNPLLTVLILFEIARLVIPPLTTWPARSPNVAGLIAIAIGSLALVIATLDAIGLYAALASSALLSSADGRVPLHGIASLVAGVAFLIWLADRIRLPTLVFAGFWVVWSIPLVAELRFSLSVWVEFFRTGAMPGLELLLLAAAVGLGPLALVFVAGALRAGVARGGGHVLGWSALLVWPPLVAGYLSRYVALAAAEFIASRSELPFHAAFTIAWSGTMALTLPLVMLLYVRATRRAFPQGADWVGRRTVLGLLVLVQVGICVWLELSTLRGPFALDGASLIALVIVCWALVQAVRPLGAESGARSERSTPPAPDVADRNWLQPWEPLGTTRADARVREQWEAELRRELGPDHALSALLPAWMIARRFDREDALFQLDDGRVALVQLTWSQRRETDPLSPPTTIYDTLDEWALSDMPRAHAEWTGRHHGQGLETNS